LRRIRSARQLLSVCRFQSVAQQTVAFESHGRLMESCESCFCSFELFICVFHSVPRWQFFAIIILLRLDDMHFGNVLHWVQLFVALHSKGLMVMFFGSVWSEWSPLVMKFGFRNRIITTCDSWWTVNYLMFSSSIWNCD
jgi:hypothetical protein